MHFDQVTVNGVNNNKLLTRKVPVMKKDLQTRTNVRIIILRAQSVTSPSKIDAELLIKMSEVLQVSVNSILGIGQQEYFI